MPEKLISGDNHIDLTYLPPDLWSSAGAERSGSNSAPRVEERDDGLHWFVDDQDRGMWNGIGPGFLPYQKGMFGHIDEMKDFGFEWSSKPGAKPRPTTPELRLADLDRDGQDAEIIYGCLMVNDLIDDASLRAWPTRPITTGSPISPSAPTRTASFRWRSSRTPTRPRRRPRCGAAPRWDCAAAISPSSG